MLAQSIELAELGLNMQVKMPCTSAGVAMIEEATFQGVNLNVTVSFSVPQVLAIGEAIERGLVRRDAAGMDTSHMAPVATMMVGRLDDWLKIVAKRDASASPTTFLIGQELPVQSAHISSLTNVVSALDSWWQRIGISVTGQSWLVVSWSTPCPMTGKSKPTLQVWSHRTRWGYRLTLR